MAWSLLTEKVEDHAMHAMPGNWVVRTRFIQIAQAIQIVNASRFSLLSTREFTA